MLFSKSHLSILVAGLSLAGAFAHASLGDATQGLQSPSNDTVRNEQIHENLAGTFMPGNRYALTRMAMPQPLDINGQAQGDRITLPRGAEFEVIENFRADDGREFVRIGLDVEEDYANEIPSDTWVDATDLMIGMPQMIDMGAIMLSEANTLNVATDETASVYADEDLAGPATHSTRKTTTTHGGMTYCYRHVKQYLMSACGFKVYLPGGAAYQAITLLPKYGFKKIAPNWNSYKTLPGCTVCVSTGGKHNCGTKSHFQACGDAAVKHKTGNQWMGWKDNLASPILGGHKSAGCWHL